MRVEWDGVEEELLTRGTAIHIGLRRGWGTSVDKGFHLVVGTTHALVLVLKYAACWDDLPEDWRQRFKGIVPDPVTVSNYGLYAVKLLRID